MTYRRDPFASTRRAHCAERRARERENMSDLVLKEKMKLIIRERLEIDEPVSLDQFRQANLPMDRVPGMFKGALAAARNAMAMDRT